MTMPSKNRHNITVNNIKYHYMVSKTKMVTIQDTETQQLIKVQVPENKIWSVQPAHVKAMIVSKGAKDWEQHMEQKFCSCGAVGSPEKSICVFDVEIHINGESPHYCNCCNDCRDRCAANV